MAIDWREKFVATAIHFVVTLVLAACAAALIFLVWFPHPFETMIGGTELFLLVVGCDLALGPLISLVIYNSRKSRRELIIDYSIVGVVQIAALVYGVYIVAGTRPVYVAFSKDRLEVVTARDITDGELAAARDPAYADLPLDGPRLVAIEVPRGRPAATRCSSRWRATRNTCGRSSTHRTRPSWRRSAGAPSPLEALGSEAPRSRSRCSMPRCVKLTIPAERLRWLPVHHREGFWTALIDIDTANRWPTSTRSVVSVRVRTDGRYCASVRIARQPEPQGPRGEHHDADDVDGDDGADAQDSLPAHAGAPGRGRRRVPDRRGTFRSRFVHVRGCWANPAVESTRRRRQAEQPGCPSGVSSVWRPWACCGLFAGHATGDTRDERVPGPLAAVMKDDAQRGGVGNQPEIALEQHAVEAVLGAHHSESLMRASMMSWWPMPGPTRSATRPWSTSPGWRRCRSRGPSE